MDKEPNSNEGLVERFEAMLRGQSSSFFDEDELEELAEHYMDALQNRKALEVIALARTQHPFSPLFIVLKAQVHVQLGENQVALEILEEAERMEPFFGEIHMTRGSIYGQMGLHEKAMLSYKRAGEYDVPEEEVKFCCAFEFTNMGRYKEAIPLLRRVLAINPDYETAAEQ